MRKQNENWEIITSPAIIIIFSRVIFCFLLYPRYGYIHSLAKNIHISDWNPRILDEITN